MTSQEQLVQEVRGWESTADEILRTIVDAACDEQWNYLEGEIRELRRVEDHVGKFLGVEIVFASRFDAVFYTKQRVLHVSSDGRCGAERVVRQDICDDFNERFKNRC